MTILLSETSPMKPIAVISLPACASAFSAQAAARSLLWLASTSVLLGLGVTSVAWSTPASELSRHMPAGDWLITYDRKARIDTLHYKKADNGSSHVCIGNDPRRVILDWLEKKHCTIAQDTLFGKSWRLGGECRVKWTKKPIPINVEVVLGDGRSFVMDTRTAHGEFLDFREHAVITRVGATCAAD